MNASIIVPVFNLWSVTARCLDTLQRTARNTEVIVVDNGSSDETGFHLDRRAKHEKSYELRVVTNAENRNFAGGCNDGLRQATRDNVVFLNNDTVPQPGWLAPLLVRLQTPEVGVVGALLWYPGRPQRAQHAGMAFSGELQCMHLYRGMTAKDAPGIHNAKDLQCVTGACMALRRDVALQLGGFDEAYRNGWEDVDLCFRVRLNLGLRVVYEPRSQLVHEEGQTPGRYIADADNRGLFMSRWGGNVRADGRDIIQRIDGGVRA